jgi:hypothetical protein
MEAITLIVAPLHPRRAAPEIGTIRKLRLSFIPDAAEPPYKITLSSTNHQLLLFHPSDRCSRL